MSEGHLPIARQIIYLEKADRLTVTIPGQSGNVSGKNYHATVTDANQATPIVDSTATPGSGNILATSNPFSTPASSSTVTIEFVFSQALPTGYTLIEVDMS